MERQKPEEGKQEEAVEAPTRAVTVGVSGRNRCARREGRKDRIWWLIGCGGEGISQPFKGRMPPPSSC